MAFLSTHTINKIAEDVNNLGFYKIENFLKKDTVDKVIGMFPKEKPKDKELKIKIPVHFYSFIIKLFKLQFRLFFTGIYLLNLKRKLNCDKIMEKVQSKNCKLVSMDIVYNPKSDEPIKKWHADQLHNFNGKDKSIYKFFIYLTPTSTNNGCLAYIKKSNILSNTIADLMFRGALPKEVVYTLKQYSNFVSRKEVRDKILQNKNANDIDLNEVINSVNKINNNPSTNELDIQIKNSGDCLLFDETGMHRGAQSKQDRYVLRFLYQNINN